MGKRKNYKKIQHIKKKIRRLEDKLQKIPVELESEDSSRPSSPLPRTPPSPPMPSPVRPPSPTLDENNLNQDHNTGDELPEDLLQALGPEGEEKTEVGEPIRPELAQRWTKIMQMGLGKEPREAIVKKYHTPVNFPRAVAPLLNPEISASLAEVSTKRDRRITYRQNLTGKLMTCLGKSLTKILTGNINTKILVEEINDAAKLAADIYNQDSNSRKFFALAGANKTVQDAVRSAITDEFLFGADCNEKIRSAQAVQKTSSLIKTLEKKTNKPVKKQVNWRSPLQHQNRQQARGGQQLQQARRQPRYEQPRQKTRKPASGGPRSRYHR